MNRTGGNGGGLVIGWKLSDLFKLYSRYDISGMSGLLRYDDFHLEWHYIVIKSQQAPEIYKTAHSRLVLYYFSAFQRLCPIVTTFKHLWSIVQLFYPLLDTFHQFRTLNTFGLSLSRIYDHIYSFFITSQLCPTVHHVLPLFIITTFAYL